MSKVRGWRQVIRNLSNYDRRTSSRIVDAVQATQAQVVNEARRVVPVRTANLQNSIGPGKIVITNTRVRGRVFALMEYASYVEFGTSRQRAKPYLGPSLLKNEGLLRSNVARAMKP